MTVVKSTGSHCFCYEPLIKMITVQSLWHIIIWNRCMSQDLNQYSMVTIMHSVNILYLQNFLFLGLSMKFLSGFSALLHEIYHPNVYIILQ